MTPTLERIDRLRPEPRDHWRYLVLLDGRQVDGALRADAERGTVDQMAEHARRDLPPEEMPARDRKRAEEPVRRTGRVEIRLHPRWRNG